MTLTVAVIAPVPERLAAPVQVTAPSADVVGPGCPSAVASSWAVASVATLASTIVVASASALASIVVVTPVPVPVVGPDDDPLLEPGPLLAPALCVAPLPPVELELAPDPGATPGEVVEDVPHAASVARMEATVTLEVMRMMGESRPFEKDNETRRVAGRGVGEITSRTRS